MRKTLWPLISLAVVAVGGILFFVAPDQTGSRSAAAGTWTTEDYLRSIYELLADPAGQSRIAAVEQQLAELGWKLDLVSQKVGTPGTLGGSEHIRIFEGESKTGNFQEALDEALWQLGEALSEDGVMDAMGEWVLTEVTGLRGGIAGFQNVTVKITTRRGPDWNER